MSKQKLSFLNLGLLFSCYFFIGFALLSLEVIWGRLTGLTLGSAIQAYSITLAAVMAGLFFARSSSQTAADRQLCAPEIWRRYCINAANDRQASGNFASELC